MSLDHNPKQIIPQCDLSAIETTLHQILNNTENLASIFIAEDLPSNKFTIEYLQRNGLKEVLFFGSPDGLDCKIPKDFTVADIRSNIGSRKQVVAVDHSLTSQNRDKTINICLKDWEKYVSGASVFSVSRMDVQLCLECVEYSATKLEGQVSGPRTIRQIDWIDQVWPRYLRDLTCDSTDTVEEWMYPRVQKLCCMSVRGCLSNYYISPGGSSMWFHCQSGSVSFFFVGPPTDATLQAYVEAKNKKMSLIEYLTSLSKSNDSSSNEFPPLHRVDLVRGQSLVIPPGWAHFKFSNEDSIMLYSIFLHSYSIEQQLQVLCVEQLIDVEIDRFPFIHEMYWYMLDRYVHCLTGRHHLTLPDDEIKRIQLDKGPNVDPNKELFKLGGRGSGTIITSPPKEHVHLTKSEISGIMKTVFYLDCLEVKDVPLLMEKPEEVIADIKELIKQHINDDSEEAITGKSVLRWSDKPIGPSTSKMITSVLYKSVTESNATVHSKLQSPVNVSDGGSPNS